MGNSTFPKAPKLPSDCFRVINKTLVWEVLLLCRDTVGVFYSPS